MPFFGGINDIVGDALSGVAAAQAEAATHAPRPASTGGAGILRIDPAQVDAAINVFQDAVQKLKQKVKQAQKEIRANPMAEDLVSRPAALAFNHASLGGSGAAISAWIGAVDELESIIRQLRASKEANVGTDDIVSQPFSSAAGAMG